MNFYAFRQPDWRAMDRMTAYGAFIDEDDETGKKHRQISIQASTIEGLKDRIDRRSEAEEVQDNEKIIEGEREDSLSPLGLDFFKFYEKIKAFYDVASLCGMLPRAMMTGFFGARLVKHAEKHFQLIENYKGIPIYGLNSEDVAYVHRNLRRWDDTEAFEVLPRSLLLGIIALYDSLFSEISINLLRSRPERYSGSERQYSVSEILRMNSIDDFIEKLVSDEVDAIMGKSYQDQIKFFEKSFNIDVSNSYKHWPVLIEMFERRNLAAHGDLIVDAKYLDNCSKAGMKINEVNVGDVLKVDETYLFSVIDTLIEFGCRLILEAWIQQLPKRRKEAFDPIVEISYELLKDKRYNLVSNLLEHALRIRTKGATDATVKMMVVNRSISLKKINRIDEAIKLIEQEDWSSCDSMYTTCACAVKEEVDDTLIHLSKAAQGGLIGLHHIREWPAFDWVRADATFNSRCEDIFGEPANPKAMLETHQSSQ